MKAVDGVGVEAGHLDDWSVALLRCLGERADAERHGGEFGEVITAGEVESFPTNSVTEFPAVHLYVIRAQDGGFLAVHSRCPHLGCTVTWVPFKTNSVRGRFV